MKKFVLTMTALAMFCALPATAQKQSVKRLYTEAQSLKVEQVKDTDTPVQVYRYLYAGYNTLCLPMTMSAEQLAATGKDLRIERLEAIRQEGSTLQLHFVDCTSEGIQAGMPYLIFSPTHQYLKISNSQVNGIDTAIKTVRLNDGQGNQVSFSSSWDKRQKDGLYGIPSNQGVEILESVLVRTTEELAFLPTRCGFSWEQQSATANKLEIIHSNSSVITAIKNVKSETTSDGSSYYDLNGRNTSKPAQKGLYIHDGKKIVVK